MTTIGIIGATGQVGTEVCLFLKTYPDVRVVAIARSHLSTALLRRLGVECRVGLLADEAQCRALLEDCDLVADFSVRMGEAAETVSHYRNNISKAMRFSRAGSRYVFISSILAFGFGGPFNRAKEYILPHSLSAATKRFGERLTIRLGKTYHKEAFAFRLGQVHGLLQRVSWETKNLVNRSYRSFEYPATPSCTIFCHSIAEALINVAAGKEQPGLYVLISEPAWSWKEVLEHYADGTALDVRLIAPARNTALQSLAGTIRQRVFDTLVKYRGTLQATALRFLPDLERKQKAVLYTNRAQQQIDVFERQFVYRAEGLFEGAFPGHRLTTLSDSRISMATRTEEVTAMLKRLTQVGAAQRAVQ